MNIKSLLLGSAAGVLAVTGAQAADLPVAPEPIDYVRVCDAFGAGYYYIPGTDTCLSVRGRVRAEYRYFDSEYVTHWRDYNSSQFRARGYLYMDSRTNTEFGLLRAYNEIWVTTDSPGSTSLSLWNSFIQFGGFTFGKTGSFYDFVVYPTWAWYFNPGVSDTRQLMGAYTFAFGNGFSSSIALESNEERRAYNQWGASGIVGYAPDYGGTKYPDLVANLRIDQGWGSAQLSGALHQVYAGYNAVGTTPGGELGWGVQGGVDFNLPFAAGASAYLQGAYTQGAVSYAATNVFVPLDAGDATYNPVTGDLDLATAWSVSGGFGFSFTPTVGANIAAGYVNYEDGYTSANDFSNILVNGNIQWTPVSGLVIGTEVDYAYVDADSASGVDDGSIWGASFRVQRTF